MLVNFKENGKWGYYNSKTQKTIPAQFRDDSDFVDGFAIVKQYSNSLYGVIDEDGKEILPFFFNLIERQENGLFKVGSYDFNCLYNNNGKIVYDDGIALEEQFQKYDVIKAFGNDLYIFKKEATKGVIYKEKIIIEKDDPYHDYVEIIPYLHFFRLKDSQGKYKYYNYDGLQIFLEAYDIQLISDEHVVFYAGYNKGYGIANAIGEILLPAKYNEITHVGGDVFLLNYKKEQKDDDLLVKYNVKLNSFIVKDDEKEIAIPKSVDWCGDFEERKALIATNYKYGILDVNSNICVPCNYDEIRLGHGNVVVVKEQDKYKLLDWVNGEIKAVFDEIKHLRDSYFVFKEKWNYGVIDNDGIKIIPAHYNRDIELLEDGNFRVSKGYAKNCYCIMDKNSRIIIMTSKGLIRLPEEIIWANNFSEGLAIVEDSKGLYGAIDEQGKIAIPCQFNALSNFKNGFSYHYVNRYEKEKIDKLGKVILEDDKALLSDSLYESVKKLCDNRYLVQRKDDHFYAIVDRKNKIIVHFSKHQYYAVKKNEFGDDSDENVLYFSDDYRKVDALFYAKSGARIIPDPESCVIINPEYRKTRSHFSDGMAAVSNQNGLWGFVDESGIEVIPCIYDEVHDFSDGYCVVRECNTTKLIDKQGRMILSGDFEEIKIIDKESIVVTHNWYNHNQDYYEDPEVGWPVKGTDSLKFNSNGEIVLSLYNEDIAIPKEYEWSDNHFHDGYLSVCKNQRWGIINSRCELIIDCIYDDLFRYSNGVAVATMGDHSFAFDEFGRLLLVGNFKDFCFDEIGGVGNGMFLAAKFSLYSNEKNWGFVDTKGNKIIDFLYVDAKPFSHGVAQVKRYNYSDSGWGLISTDGKIITDFVYKKFLTHSSGDILAYYKYQDESPIRINEHGAIYYQYFKDGYYIDVCLYGYDWCSEIYHGLCIVMKGLNYGIIEETGTVTFPLCEMKNIKIAPNTDGYVCFNKGKEYKRVTKDGHLITNLKNNSVELPLGIQWCDEWTDGYIAVESDGEWGLLNDKLEFVLKPKFHKIQYIGNGRVLCCEIEKEEKKYSIYNIKLGKYMFLPYHECSFFDNGCAIVSKIVREVKHTGDFMYKVYSYGLIDNTGKELLPCIYSEVQFKKPVRIEYSNHDDYEESYDCELGDYDAFEDAPDARWGREW